MTLIAAAAAAVAAIAVVALPAIGDSGANGGGDDGVQAYAACLAAHGLPGAPTDGADLKPWLVRHDADTVGAATAACEDVAPGGAGAPRPDVAQMIACVRSHGVDAPTSPADFKRWVAERQSSKAVQDALIACKMAAAPDAKAGPLPGKGAGAPGCDTPPAEKPHAAKPDTPAQRPDASQAPA
jgi:hypothetical protein